MENLHRKTWKNNDKKRFVVLLKIMSQTLEKRFVVMFTFLL